MKTWILTLLFLLLASIAHAQVIDSYVARYYTVGATAPVQTETILVAAAVCGQVPPVTTLGSINPRRVIWDDTVIVGRVCIYTSATTGVLFSLPFGTYEATLSSVAGTLSSAESARSPFSRLAPPPVPTGLRVIQ